MELKALFSEGLSITVKKRDLHKKKDGGGGGGGGGAGVHYDDVWRPRGTRGGVAAAPRCVHGDAAATPRRRGAAAPLRRHHDAAATPRRHHDAASACVRATGVRCFLASRRRGPRPS